ncbi:ribosome biogenesis GTPase Der, partial [bacterium]
MAGKEVPLISIVGRPNVGKSTLFNRLLGRRVAIVDDMPGVTRDRIFARCRFGDVSCHIVDTGGLTEGMGKDTIEAEVEKQILMSIDSSSALIFLTDVTTGLIPEDRFVADILRRKGKPVIVAANKADNQKLGNTALEFHELGLGDPIPISAQHGLNIDTLTSRLVKLLPPAEYVPGKEDPIRFCVVGRPNVGKSSITNAILGEERCVVSPIPGTTRDRVDTEFEFDDMHFLIVDTAGIKRRKTKMDNMEFYGYSRARRAIQDSDVAVLVLDAEHGLLEGDKRIAAFIMENQKCFIATVNKMDLIETPDYEMFLKNTLDSAPFMRNTPFLFLSALERLGMDLLIDKIVDVHGRSRELLPLDFLKNVIYDTRALYSTRSRGRRTGEIKNVIHDRVNPPRVILKVNDEELFVPGYLRLIENRIRSVFNLSGIPLDLVISD